MSGQIVRVRSGSCCPFCGNEMSPAIATIGSVLSRRQMELFRVLNASSAPMTVGQIAKAMFENEARGGPDWADGVVTTAVARMRKKIKQHRLPMSLRSGIGGGYFIEIKPYNGAGQS